jgi:hypothetical protein
MEPRSRGAFGPRMRHDMEGLAAASRRKSVNRIGGKPRQQYAPAVQRWIPLLVLSSVVHGVALLAAPALGQDKATDVELFAAYCKGVAEQWSRPPQAVEPYRLIEERLGKEQAERANRLDGYLMYRLAGRSADVLAATEKAREHGILDAKRCGGPNIRPIAMGVFESCAPKCGDLRSPECSSCFKEAGEAAECRLADRCLGSTLLPY